MREILSLARRYLFRQKMSRNVRLAKDMRDRVEASMKQVLLRLAAQKDRTILTSRKGT